MTTKSWTMIALMLAACGGEKDAANNDTARDVGGAVESTGDATAATGDVIVVEMITDETGNYFKPRDIKARPGDIVRFTLTTGVHNVHFVADSNKGVAGLPAAGEALQLPGQTYDFTVPSPKDDTKLFFQCDPHAALGMVGTIEIDRD